MSHFIFVIDGEVAGEMPVPMLRDEAGDLLPAIERLIAILGSDPKIVVSDESVTEGSTWDGTSFTPPVE